MLSVAAPPRSLNPKLTRYLASRSPIPRLVRDTTRPLQKLAVSLLTYDILTIDYAGQLIILDGYCGISRWSRPSSWWRFDTEAEAPWVRRPRCKIICGGALQGSAIDGKPDCAASGVPLSSRAPNGAPLRGCGAFIAQAIALVHRAPEFLSPWLYRHSDAVA